MKTTGACLLGMILLVTLSSTGTPPAQASPAPMTRQEIIDLAATGLGYSYWWGNGCWRLDGQDLGSCSGSCPSCSHSGGKGADCSGYVAKAWQVPGPSDVSTCAHPYSTSNFRWESTHWSQIPRSDTEPGDAFVYRNSSNTGGHIVIYESGDPWGSSWVYEARGCSYGIVRRLKSITSDYVAIRRDNLTVAVCDSVPAQGRIVDESESCFEAGGPAQYWRTEQAGHDGTLKWTHAVSTQVYNYGVWNLDFDQAGTYRLEAYTASPWPESVQASYQVRANGSTSAVQVDQTAVNGWTLVGEFDFAAGANQWVRLEDLTGEPGSAEIRVVFDAIRVTPVAPGSDPDPDPDPNQDPDPDPDPNQSPTCETVPVDGRVVDDNEPCFEALGPAQYWRNEQSGWGGGLLWTHATSSQVYNYGVWNLDFEQAGTYRLEAYTPAPWAESVQANYQVHHGTTTTEARVDQTAQNGWALVGEFDFAAGPNQWVRLEDLTGEPSSSDTRVVLDAIRLTLVQPSSIDPPATSCEPVPADGRVVDNAELCFEAGGPSQYWRNEQAGWDGGLLWTHATSSQAYNYALWQLDFVQAGHYRIEAYTPAPWAESRQARYQVHHEGQTTTTQVDQSVVDGWTLVGEFDFAAGDGQWVRLEDLTGESSSSNTKVVVDALRITRIGTGTGGAGEKAEADPAADPDELANGLVTNAWGCHTSPSPDAAELWWLLLPLLLIRRRRRRQRRIRRL